jgi:hypothetical protein
MVAIAPLLIRLEIGTRISRTWSCTSGAVTTWGDRIRGALDRVTGRRLRTLIGGRASSTRAAALGLTGLALFVGASCGQLATVLPIGFSSLLFI